MAQQVHPSNVVGRDALIEHIWRKLDSGSLRFTAERRIGKTTVMTKMCAEPKAGYTPVFIDVEGIVSPEGFVEKLLNAVRGELSRGFRGAHKFRKFVTGLAGVEIGGVIKLNRISQTGWAATLDKLLEGLCAESRETRIVLLFDEIPYMLTNIGGEEALNILDRLRAARQENPTLRMVFAGSVGLHHVLNNLRDGKRPSQPVNDMAMIEIKPLDLIDAVALTRRYIERDLDVHSGVLPDVLAKQIATATDCVPFYLEKVVSRLAEQSAPVTLADAARIVREQLTDDQDDRQMEHFRDRLEFYYSGTHAGAQGKDILNQDLASSILDFLALALEPLSIDAVWTALKAQHSLSDRKHIVRMLSSLAKDHYLTADTNKAYSFRFPLIRTWWITAQGLER